MCLYFALRAQRIWKSFRAPRTELFSQYFWPLLSWAGFWARERHRRWSLRWTRSWLCTQCTECGALRQQFRSFSCACRCCKTPSISAARIAKLKLFVMRLWLVAGMWTLLILVQIYLAGPCLLGIFLRLIWRPKLFDLQTFYRLSFWISWTVWLSVDFLTILVDQECFLVQMVSLLF